MKTAVSIPDSVFQEAERTARKLGITRSQLYARAVQAFLDHQADRDITKRLNSIYAEEASAMDPLLLKLQFASIPKEDW
jgi:metal-responsive CopG/Arc/MetJ family transcriptional regulator